MEASIFHKNAEGVRERTHVFGYWYYQMTGMVINNESESKNFDHGYGVRILRSSVFKVEEMQETEWNIS